MQTWESIFPGSDVALGEVERNVRQAIAWYGWSAPTKFQAISVPLLRRVVLNTAGTRRYTSMQAARGMGKTSAIALGILGACPRGVSNVKVLVLGLTGLPDIEKHVGTLGQLSPLRVCCYEASEKDNEQSAWTRVAVGVMGAEVLACHPQRLLEMTKDRECWKRLSLDDLEVVIVDDTSAMIKDGWIPKICELNAVLVGRATHTLRYVVVSDLALQEKQALRKLKDSLLKPRSRANSVSQVVRLQKSIKHYFVHENSDSFLSTLRRLRSTIDIPRGLIFCDDEVFIAQAKSEISSGQKDKDKAKTLVVAAGRSQMQSGLSASTDKANFRCCVADPRSQLEQAMEALNSGQQDFLITRSGDDVFEGTFHNVFWMIHFGLDSANLASYGCRLKCLKTSLESREDRSTGSGISLLFLPPKEKLVTVQLNRMYGIKLEELDF